MRGEFSEATSRCSEALDLARDAEHRGIQALALIVRAEIEIQKLEDPDNTDPTSADRAEEDLARAEELFEDMGNLLDLPRVLDSRARLCDLKNQNSEATDLRTRAEELRQSHSISLEVR
jgi:hypothetical protein